MIDRHSEGGLRAHSITVGYGKDSPILEGLSLDVLQGELTVIVGPNACGKSTLLRALARVLSVRCGVVELDGQVLNELNQKALAPWSPRAILCCTGRHVGGGPGCARPLSASIPRTSVEHGG